MTTSAAVKAILENEEISGRTPEDQAALDALRSGKPLTAAPAMRQTNEEPKKRRRPGRPVIDGYKFDSDDEGRRYQILKAWQLAGRISDLKVHPVYLILEGFTHPTLGKIKTINWRADFRYIQTDTGEEVIEDFKGYEYRSFRDKRPHIAAALHDKIVFINKDLTGWWRRKE